MQTAAGSRYSGLIPDLVAKAFPQACILECSQLTGGLVNSTFKLRLDSPELTLVLRIYQREPAACAREIGLLQLLRGTVPVPDVFYAEPLGTATDRPFALLSYIDGITFQQLKRSGDIAGIQKSAYDVGKILATIGRYKFADVGTLETGFAVTETFQGGRPGSQIPRPLSYFEHSPEASHGPDPGSTARFDLVLGAPVRRHRARAKFGTL